MSKAVVEISNHVIDKAINFLELVIEPPLKELGFLLQDRVKLWRFKNQIRIINKTQDIIENKKINPRKIPIKIIIPLLEYGSMEETDNMQDKWASLLSKAADSEYSLDLCSMFSEILRQLSPAEVKILDLMYEIFKNDYHEKYDYVVNHELNRKMLGKSLEEYSLLIENLLRVNLLKVHAEGVTIGLTTPEDDLKNITRLSYYGFNFVKYCRTN